jgi:hypothetical protein
MDVDLSVSGVVTTSGMLDGYASGKLRLVRSLYAEPPESVALNSIPGSRPASLSIQERLLPGSRRAI